MRNEYIAISNAEMIYKIKQSEEFRNKVAFAHGVHLGNGEEFKGTTSHPQRYRVTEEQIKIAQAIRERKIKKVLKYNKNKLLFVGMGWHEAESSGDVENCRIRTILQNNKGLNIFIELGSGKNNSIKNDPKNYIYCDFCFIVPEKSEEPKYNYNNLQTNTWNQKIEWNKKNILDYVNKNLNCSFSEIIIDNFNLNNPEKTICFSNV